MAAGAVLFDDLAAKRDELVRGCGKCRKNKSDHGDELSHATSSFSIKIRRIFFRKP
jgi:hypothetical protein